MKNFVIMALVIAVIILVLMNRGQRVIILTQHEELNKIKEQIAKST